MEQEEFLKIGQAAKLLGVNPITLRRWERAGIVSPIKIGSRGDRVYKQSDLQALLKKKPSTRENSQVKGTIGENILSELVEQALKEWKFSLTELRPQDGGIQFGKDNIACWEGTVDNEKISFAWSFEAKHYGKKSKKRVINKERILSKLAQVHGSSVPIDCWCIFSPFSDVDNEVRELVDRYFEKNKYPFRIVLWTKYEQIEEFIKCFPTIYEKLFDDKSSFTAEERKSILEKWKNLVIEKTREGKSLKAKTQSKETGITGDISPKIAKDIKKALIEEGIQISLSAMHDSEKTACSNTKAVKVNEEIDKVLPLLNQGKTQEVLPTLFLLLGEIEDKEGFAHEKARLYNNIGVAYSFEKNIDKEIEYFQKAVAAEDNFVIAMANLAAAYITKSCETSNNENAQKELDKAAKIIVPLWNGFTETSASSILQVYMRFVRAKRGLNGLIDFIKEQDNTPASRLFQSNGTFAFIIGSTYLEAHEPERALEFAKKAYDIEKNDPEVLYLRGRAFISLSIKENFPSSSRYWQDIVPVFAKKDNLRKGIKDIDSAMEMATRKEITHMLPQLSFLQRMSRIWLGEDHIAPPDDMKGMEEEKHLLEMYDAFKKRDYEHSYFLLKQNKEFSIMPYEEKIRIARAYLCRGQPEISKELFDSIREQAIKREDYIYWLDYSVIATLLGEKNMAILAAIKAREVAKGDEARRTVHSHYGAVILRFADTKEGDRVIEGAQAFEKEFPDTKILTPFDFEKEKDKIANMIKQRYERVKNIREIYNKNPIPSYYLQEVFKQPYVVVWAGRDPEMPIEFSIASEKFYEELQENYSSGKVFVFDYIALLTLSKLNLLAELENIFPKMQITISLFDKIQEEMLKKEDESLRKLWNFLRKSKVIEVVEHIKKQKLKGKKIGEIFEPWIIDTIMLAKQKNARLITDDFRFFRFVKSEDIKPVNSLLILQKTKEKKLLDSLMYSRAIGKLAECFYTFISFTGDDLFEIAFQDDFKLTARIYHLINQIFLPGTNYKSFIQVFIRYISNLWRPGMIINDKLFWLDYLTGIFAELLMRAAAGTVDGKEVLSVGADFGLMWRIALKNATKDDMAVLQTKFPEMLKQPILRASKEKIQEMINVRAKELEKL